MGPAEQRRVVSLTTLHDDPAPVLTTREWRNFRQEALTAPLRLVPNRVQRFYRGGYLLDAFLGVGWPRDDNWCEEWLGNSTAPAISATGGDGLARAVLPDGSLVTIRDLAEAEPECFYGDEHVGRYGSSPALLLKYLDVGTHIPVHVHPTREFARHHLGSTFGKNEAWLLLGTRVVDGAPAKVWVGWRDEVDESRLRKWIAAQDTTAMRAAMHAIEVHAGDALFIPSGIAHSLGAGVFAMEPQEPRDYAVFAEYAIYGLDEATATNGLGWDTALQMFDYTSLTEQDIANRIRCTPQDQRDEPGGRDRLLVSDEACQFFELNEITVRKIFAVAPDGRFAIDCIHDGSGVFRGAWGERYVRRGEAYVIPASLGEYEIRSDGAKALRIVRGRPPR